MKQLLPVFNLFLACLFLASGLNAQNLYPTKKGDYFIYTDRKGRKKIKDKFDDAKHFYGGIALVSKNNLWGIINEKGNEVLPIEYEEVNRFYKGVASVKKEGKWGFVNKEGEVAIPIEYDVVGYFNRSETTIAGKGNTYNIIGLTGEVVSPTFDTIFRNQTYYITSLNNKQGILNEDGSVLEEPKFDKVGAFYNESFTVRYNDQWGIWENQEFKTEAVELYFAVPEAMPVYDLDCLDKGEEKDIRDCSNRKMLETLYRNIRYPAIARENGVQGTVVIQFIIDKEGNCKNYKILRDIGGGCGEEGMRVLRNNVSKWERPGMMEGKAVNTIFNLPIKYRLE